MHNEIETSNNPNGQESRLWLSVALSITMIFTSYAVSVLNNRNAGELTVHTQPNRPFVISYLA